MQGGMIMNNRMKELRARRGLRQEDLAKELGCTAAHVGHLENGNRELTQTMLVALSDYFHVSIDYLLYRENLNFPVPPTSDMKIPKHVYSHLASDKKEIMNE